MEKSEQLSAAQQPVSPSSLQRRRGRLKLLLVVIICAAPVLASYLTYYVIKPQGRTNYGDLLDARDYPVPELDATTLDGAPAKLQDYQGKWVMLQVSGGECDAACQRRLLVMRQLRLMQGKDMDRIERVWLITDGVPLDTMLMREYDGTDMLRVKPEVLRAWLPVQDGGSAADHIYMMDPRGHLMLRFPKDADPNLMKKDIGKLLRASSIG